MCGVEVSLYNHPPPPAVAVVGGGRRRRTPRTAPSLTLRLVRGYYIPFPTGTPPAFQATVRGYSFACLQEALRHDFQSRFIYHLLCVSLSTPVDVFNPSVTMSDSSPICLRHTGEEKVTTSNPFVTVWHFQYLVSLAGAKNASIRHGVNK